MIQPWGPERDNYHAALQAHIMASAHTPKGARRPQMSDFFYRDPVTRQEMQGTELYNWLEGVKVKGPEDG